jgi:transmembrane sensor
VLLGPESRLAVSTAYGTTAREVRLEGQGYFEVIHDERQPFAVYAGGSVARDLGTKFDVRAYPTDGRVRVTVAEGQVALETQVLSPGQAGERTADGKIAVQSGVDLEHALAWTQGTLAFEELPLVQALPELERWYGLRFRLADSRLAQVPLTGMLGDRADAETLELLALLLGVRVEQHGDTVVLGHSRR